MTNNKLPTWENKRYKISSMKKKNLQNPTQSPHEIKIIYVRITPTFSNFGLKHFSTVCIYLKNDNIVKICPFWYYFIEISSKTYEFNIKC